MTIRNKGLEKEIAAERIEVLFDLAVKDVDNKDSRSKRYVKLLQKISSHYKVTVPKRIKSMICKNCSNVIVPGVNGKVRLASSNRRLLYICNTCGKANATPY